MTVTNLSYAELGGSVKVLEAKVGWSANSWDESYAGGFAGA